MSRFSFSRFGLWAAVMAFSGHASAGNVSLSGAVQMPDGTPLSGVTVRLVQAGLSATTDAQGAWALVPVATGVAGARMATIANARNLHLENGRLQVRLDGRDIAGRGQAGALVGARAQFGTSARLQADTPDTLEYSYNQKVFLRDTLSRFDIAGIVRVYDTTVNPKIIHGYLKDARNGSQYRSVAIGSQVWMAENLNLKVDSSWCYNDSAKNCTTYGRLYKWAAAIGLNDSCNTKSCASQMTATMQGVCPSGWHVPTSAEWKKLTDTALVAATAGRMLKANSGLWGNGAGTDDYGFHGLPSGFHGPFGDFQLLGEYGYCWSATVNNGSVAYGVYFNSNNGVARNIDQKTYGFSLRCIQN